MFRTIELFGLESMNSKILTDFCDFINLDMRPTTYDENVSFYELDRENIFRGSDFMYEMWLLW